MASNAANLANFLSGDTLTVKNATDRVGIGSTLPTSSLDVAGVVSATSFYGDGSNLEGVNSVGLGTALSDEGPLSVIYYTNDVLTVGSTITVDIPDSSSVAYTQYPNILLEDDADLIISDGDDFVPDILGLSTVGVTPIAGSGGRIRADFFSDHAGTGAPTFQTGLNVEGNLSVGGTITYEDVTNVDSVGVITARSGIVVTGVVTATSYQGDGSQLNGVGAELDITSCLFF